MKKKVKPKKKITKKKTTKRKKRSGRIKAYTMGEAAGGKGFPW